VDQKRLEWVTAAQAKAGFDVTLGSVYKSMGGAVALATISGLLVFAAGRPLEVQLIAAPSRITQADRDLYR
jgi:transcriptional regulator GlxA family with amidase domain